MSLKFGPAPRQGVVAKVGFFCLAVLFYAFALHARVGQELADDGAFLLRYAENMVAGHFWVWNIGEPPVWGASAPLYPLLVAIPIALGLAPLTAMIATGLVLTAGTLAGISVLLASRFGWMAGVAFVVLSSLDSQVMYHAGSGLESPLTLAVLGLGVWVLLGGANAWVVGLVAALLMVHKLDLVPAGGLLLLASWMKEGRFPARALAVASLIGLAWYGFAWVYFGAPVPNSFLTKALHQADLHKIIDWRWFGGLVLFSSLHPWLVALTGVAGAERGRTLFPMLIFLDGLLVTHLIAYTIKYPFEPYNWYAIPSLLALLVVGSIGVSSVVRLLSRGSPGALSPMASIAGALLLGVIVFSSYATEVKATRKIENFTSHQERDRADAGRWVADNTPPGFSVFTLWGNPAYYSRRYVLDGSFLNRQFEPDDLIRKYRPEILILQGNPGVTPMDPVFPAAGPDYEVVKLFDRTHTAGMDYFFAVLAREDVAESLPDRDRLINLLRFVKKPQLGDQWGILKPHGRQLFIHPGTTTPTRFEFDAAAFLKETGQDRFRLDAAMAATVPEEAVERGGANVKLSLFHGGKLIQEAVIKVGQPFSAALDAQEDGSYEIVIDNNGSPDTDWLLLSIR